MIYIFKRRCNYTAVENSTYVNKVHRSRRTFLDINIYKCSRASQRVNFTFKKRVSRTTRRVLIVRNMCIDEITFHCNFSAFIDASCQSLL